ncbi:hypothetical protein MRX96_011822 [Rhipicephalus microplus]
MRSSVCLCLLVYGLGLVAADTPANCTYDETRGWWTFTEGPRVGDRSIRCDNWTPGKDATKGFEVVLNFRRYFAFSNYSESESFCGSTKAGWAHDILGHNWACFEGHRDEEEVRRGKPLQAAPLRREIGDTVDPFNSEEFVVLVNKAQRSWTAKVHEPFRGKTLNQMMSIRGGHRNRNFRNPPPAAVTEEQRKLASTLPEEFDWRNVSGVNYVSPVRNQDSCGSCYAFSSMALLESRLRIATNNRVKRVFSPQDIVSCSPLLARFAMYTFQRCSGGFPYLIGGKYAQDFGVVDEACNPYTGGDGPCKTSPNCTRHYVAKYRYCGGILRSLERGSDAAYSGGVYQHTTLHRQLGGPFDPFELTNHAVLVVGYGFDHHSQLPYWTVKNSWGPEWGESGFFRIRRGNDECGIESLAVEVEPIP